MKEYKLIPLNEVDTYVNVSPLKNTVESQNVDSKPSPVKNVEKSQNLGRDEFKDCIVNLVMDKDADDHFKIILLNYMSQKMDNKTNENISEKISKEENKSHVNANVFDIIKHDILPSQVSNAYRIFTHFIDKNDVEWDDKGNINIDGIRIGLDIYKLLKYLTTRNMKIEEDDRNDLKRVLYSTHPIIKI